MNIPQFTIEDAMFNDDVAFPVNIICDDSPSQETSPTTLTIPTLPLSENNSCKNWLQVTPPSSPTSLRKTSLNE